MKTYEELTKATKNLITKLILEAAENRKGPEGYKADGDCLEEVEHISRDGFIPSSDNKGGLLYRNFTDIMAYFGGGHKPAHQEANNEIEAQIDYQLKNVSEQMAEEIGSEDLEYYFGNNVAKVNYSNLQELTDTLEQQGQLESAKKVKRWVNRIQDIESDFLGDPDSSIMHEFRFLYHGVNSNGTHEASVSAAINTEGPYHRSHISWLPDIFCEGAKEVTIKWKNNAELKRKLSKALSKVSKAIF